jgi:hypothetical protein
MEVEVSSTNCTESPLAKHTLAILEDIVGEPLPILTTDSGGMKSFRIAIT